MQVVYGALASIPVDVGLAFQSRVDLPRFGQALQRPDLRNCDAVEGSVDEQVVVEGPRDLQQFGCENKRGRVNLPQFPCELQRLSDATSSGVRMAVVVCMQTSGMATNSNGSKVGECAPCCADTFCQVLPVSLGPLARCETSVNPPTVWTLICARSLSLHGWPALE